MSSSDPNIYFKKFNEEKTENREEEQLEQFVHEILLSTISSLKTVNQPVEVIPSTTLINPRSVQIRKLHKATGPGIIYGKDGKTVINFDQKCPPIPYCEGVDVKKFISQTVILVYPARFLVNVTNERGERIPDVYAEVIREDEVARKDFFVYILVILIIQMIFTFYFIFVCNYIPCLADALKKDRIIYIYVLVMNVLLFILLLCFEAVRKKCPINFLVITLFTICSAYLMSYMQAIKGTHQTFLFSFFTTLIILIAIGILAWANNYDFTIWINITVSLLITGIAFFMIAQVYFRVTGRSFLMNWFYFIFLIIICLSLLHQFQLILGEGRYAIDTDEHILATCIMYLHINIMYTIFHKLLEDPHK